MYFESNLPEAPLYLDVALTAKYIKTKKKIEERMLKLENAMKYSGMEPKDFAATAKVIFDNFPNFDDMSESTICATCKLIGTDVHAEERLDWPNAEVVVDTAFVRTKEWETLRVLGIGGSDAAVIFGDNSRRGLYELYHDKLGTPFNDRLRDESEERAKTAIFNRGHAMENTVIDAYCRKTGAKRIPETRMFRSKTHPDSTANLDGIIRKTNGEIWVMEAKTTKQENARAWAEWGGVEKIPRQYICQTRQYPAVLADDRIMGTVIGVIPVQDVTALGEYATSAFDIRQAVYREVPRDKEREFEILEEERLFMEDNVRACIPPEIESATAKSEISVLISTTPEPEPEINRNNEDEIVKLCEKYTKLSERTCDLERQKKELDEKKKAVEFELMEALGTAPVNIVGDGEEAYYLTYKASKTAKLDEDMLLALFPDAHSVCRTETVRKPTLRLSHLSARTAELRATKEVAKLKAEAEKK